jgi:hypothetical protein
MHKAHKKHYFLVGVIIICLFGAVGCWGIGRDDEFDNCEGDNVMYCEDSSNGWGDYDDCYVDKNCRYRFDSTCFEGKDKDGNGLLGCIIPDLTCDEDEKTICHDNKQVICASNGKAIYTEGCFWGDEPFCLESVVKPGESLCAYQDEYCNEEEGMCDGSGYLSCGTSGVWWRFYECFGLEPHCVDWVDSNGVPKANCVMSTSLCDDGAKTLCINDNVASCSESGYWVLEERCWNWGCVQIDESNAECGDWD